MKATRLDSAKRILGKDLENAAFRERWERTALARGIATCLVSYRAEHGLSQTRLAEMLAMKQPAVARLEAGEKNPNWDTLVRLSTTLGIEIIIDIVPGRRKSVLAGHLGGVSVLERVATAGGRFVVAVG